MTKSPGFLRLPSVEVVPSHPSHPAVLKCVWRKETPQKVRTDSRPTAKIPAALPPDGSRLRSIRRRGFCRFVWRHLAWICRELELPSCPELRGEKRQNSAARCCGRDLSCWCSTSVLYILHSDRLGKHFCLFAAKWKQWDFWVFWFPTFRGKKIVQSHCLFVNAKLLFPVILLNDIIQFGLWAVLLQNKASRLSMWASLSKYLQSFLAALLRGERESCPVKKEERKWFWTGP